MTDHQFDWMRETIYEPRPQIERPANRSWFLPILITWAIVFIAIGSLLALALALAGWWS